VGDEGTLAHSEDWIMRYIQNLSNRSLLDIVYANSKYFAVGIRDTIISSKDRVK